MRDNRYFHYDTTCNSVSIIKGDGTLFSFDLPLLSIHLPTVPPPLFSSRYPRRLCFFLLPPMQRSPTHIVSLSPRSSRKGGLLGAGGGRPTSASGDEMRPSVVAEYDEVRRGLPAHRPAAEE